MIRVWVKVRIWDRVRVKVRVIVTVMVRVSKAGLEIHFFGGSKLLLPS